MTKVAESKFDRSKFRDNTKSDELKAADRSVENTIRQGGDQGTYAGFISLENGLNKFLIYPSHEAIKQMMGEDVKNEPFIVPKQVYWLPREVEEKDEKKDEKKEVKKDKKGNAITKIINMPVYDARIHSEVKKCIVDVYVNILKKQFEDELGTDKAAQEAIKEKMAPIYGKWSNNPQFRVQGIISKPAWVMYVQKVVGDQKIFGRLEIGKAVKMRLNELIAIEEANTPIGSDSNNPFTNVEERRALIIKYNKEATDAKLFYITEIDTSNTKGVLNMHPLSDAELEEFLKYPSLSSQYKNCYTQKDFELAVKGLQMFDEKFEFGIFANKEFMDNAESMRELYPEKESVGEAAPSVEEEDGKDKFASMDRNELKEFARKEKTGIVAHSKLTDEDLRNALRDWQKDQDGTTDSVDEEKKSDDILDSKPSVAGVKSGSAREKIDAIRKNGANAAAAKTGGDKKK